MQNSMRLKNKKAVSSIIVAILFILLVVAIAAIIMHFIINIGPLLSPGSGCSELKNSAQISIGKACFNNITKEYEINVQRFGNIDILSMEFMINNGNISFWKCGCASCTIVGNGEIKTYYISAPDLVYNGDANIGPGASLIINECELSSKNITLC
jgi:hypothetical protein